MKPTPVVSIVLVVLFSAGTAWSEPFNPQSDEMVAKLKAAKADEREGLFRAHLLSLGDQLPPVKFRFRVTNEGTVTWEGMSVASRSGAFCAAGKTLVPSSGRPPQLFDFLVYQSKQKRGYWQADAAVAMEEIGDRSAADPALLQRLAMFRIPSPLLFAYGDGERTIEQICEEFKAFRRETRIEDDGRLISLAVFHHESRAAVAPFVKIFVAPEHAWGVQRIEWRWRDGRLGREMVIKRREVVQHEGRGFWIPVEIDDRDFDTPRASRHTLIEKLGISATDPEDAQSDLTSMCGAAPRDTHLSRRFPDGSSVLYAVGSDGTLIPQRAEPAALAASDELFLDTGRRRTWRDSIRIGASGLAVAAIILVCARRFRDGRKAMSK
ncbi:MAG: hypothetical protein WBD40_22405 [Tepidisphaeraceae bacterium]